MLDTTRKLYLGYGKLNHINIVKYLPSEYFLNLWTVYISILNLENAVIYLIVL